MSTMMERIGTVLIVIGLVIAMIAIPIGAAGAISQPSTDAPNDTQSVEPGAHIAGVVGIQHAELDGDVADRTFGIKVAQAQTDDEAADIVAERLGQIEERLAAHETSIAELQRDRDAGNMSESTYRAKVATLVAEKNQTERAAGQTAAVAEGLPEDVLRDRGINVEAIHELRINASELGGPEVSEIARSIAGSDGANERDRGPPEQSPAGDSPADRPDRGAANATERGR